MTTLAHLTLNTGHLSTSTRADVDQRAVDHLLPLLDASGGSLPGVEGWHLAAYYPRGDGGAARPGAAYFQVAEQPGMSKTPVVMAFACWAEDQAADTWRMTLKAYEAQRVPLRQVELWREPPDMPPLPWLAVWLTPFIGLADVTTLGWLGDLERCVAWALMER